VADFALDTEVEGRDGAYRAVLSPDWSVWGPLGGYVAAIALRAIGRQSAQPRPASFSCQFLRVGKPGRVDVAVSEVGGERRAQALRAVLSQGGTPLLAATAWMVADGIAGFEHDASRAPDVPRPQSLPTVAQATPSMLELFPFWRIAEGRPVEQLADPESKPPFWRGWIRLPGAAPKGDLLLDAARSVVCMDVMMWIAGSRPHPRPRLFVAPNLDLTVQFNGEAGESEWLLCDGAGETARHGLLGCSGRIWTGNGKLAASGTAQLLCQPNPGHAADVERERLARG
jgi:acyl-CoA thioesterase